MRSERQIFFPSDINRTYRHMKSKRNVVNNSWFLCHTNYHPKLFISSLWNTKNPQQKEDTEKWENIGYKYRWNITTRVAYAWNVFKLSGARSLPATYIPRFGTKKYTFEDKTLEREREKSERERQREREKRM